MPPVKEVTAPRQASLTLMPLLLLLEIRPLLIMPPPKLWMLRTKTPEVRDEIVPVPALEIPPVKVVMSSTRMPPRLAELIVPLLVMPPMKLEADRT